MDPFFHRALTIHSIWAAFPQFPVCKLADAAPLNTYIDEVGAFLDQGLTNDERDYACLCSDFSQGLQRHQDFQGPLAARLFAVGSRHWLARQDRNNPHSNTGMLMSGSFWKGYSAECIRTFAPDRSLDWRSHVAAVSEFTKSLIKATWGNANTEYYCRHMPNGDDHEVVMDSLGMTSLSPGAGRALVFHEFMHGIKDTDNAFLNMFESAQRGGYKGTRENLHPFFNSYEDIAVNVAGGSVLVDGLEDFRELYQGGFLANACHLTNHYSIDAEFWVCSMARGIGETNLPFIPSAEVQGLIEKHRGALDDITGARSLPISKTGLICREVCINPQKLEPFSRYRGEAVARLFFKLQEEFSGQKEQPKNFNGPSNVPRQQQPDTSKSQEEKPRDQLPSRRQEALEGSQAQSMPPDPSKEKSPSKADRKLPGDQEKWSEHNGQENQAREQRNKAAEQGRNAGDQGGNSGDQGEKPAATRNDGSELGEAPAAKAIDPSALGKEHGDIGSEPGNQSEEPAAKGKDPSALGKEHGDLGNEPGNQGEEPTAKGKDPSALGKNPAAMGSESGHHGEKPAAKGKEPTDQGRNRTEQHNQPGCSGHQSCDGEHEGPFGPDFSGLGEVGKDFELKEPLLGGKEQGEKTTADPDGKFKALENQIPATSASREDLLEDGVLGYGAPVDMSALREAQQEFAPIIRRGKRLFQGIRKNAERAVQHRAKLVEEGDMFSIRGMSLRRSDPEHTLVYENPAPAIAVNYARFALILDMSGSTEHGKRFGRLVEMASVAALAIEDAGYQTSLGLFSGQGLLLYHAEYPKNEKMRRLGGLIKVVRHSHDLKAGAARVGLTRELGFMGGTESEKAVGTFVEAITKSQTRKPGHFHGLIFTDGELREKRLQELISANPNVTWSVLCEGAVTEEAEEHFGKENTYAVQLDGDFIETIFGAFSDSIKKFGSFQSAAKIRTHYQRTLRDARRMPQEKVINVIK